MSSYFGFPPVTSGTRYFVSYKNEDSERVGEICKKLNSLGVPLWYDDAIDHGKSWEAAISRNVAECDAIIIFATSELFKKDSYVQMEYEIAVTYYKPIFTIWMDDISDKDVNRDIISWYLKLRKIQGVEIKKIPKEQIPQQIISKFRLISDLPSDSILVPSHDKRMTTVLSDLIKKKSVMIGIIVVAAFMIVSFTVLGVLFSGSKKSVVSTSDKTQLSSENEIDVDEDEPIIIKNVTVGDIIPFGKYMQNISTPEPINWRVLDIKDGKALLISDLLLDTVQYNDKDTGVTWETCSLRKWLNDDFINTAFSKSEQKKIATVQNSNTDNSRYLTRGGNDTYDQIFLLSSEEAYHYFPKYPDRLAAVTAYNIKRGCYIDPNDTFSDGSEAGWWWLRTPGDHSYRAVIVVTHGEIRTRGHYVTNEGGSIRPAFWLILD